MKNISTNIRAISTANKISDILKDSELDLVLQYYILKDLMDNTKTLLDTVVQKEIDEITKEKEDLSSDTEKVEGEIIN